MKRTCLLMAILLAGCGKAPTPVTPPKEAQGGPDSIGVVILIDTSGSMSYKVSDGDGGKRPKNQLASEAVAEVLRRADKWTAANPNRPFNLSIISFADSAHPVLAMGLYDADTAHRSLKNIPSPGGGTAIGSSLEVAWSALKPLKCGKSFIVCVTDGESNSGPHPKEVLRRIKAEGGDTLEVYFVAFDVDQGLFAFAGKNVLSATDGKGLDAALGEIFTSRVFWEGGK